MNLLQIMMITGIANLVFLILILSSCRCLGFWKITKPFINYKFMQIIYKKHCYFWYGLIISVLVHAVTALTLYGFGF